LVEGRDNKNFRAYLITQQNGKKVITLSQKNFMQNHHDEITQLLLDLSGGNRSAVDALMPLVYEELRQLAHRQLRQERQGHTLNTTALVHEAYMKLIDQQRVNWQNRAHFFALAAQAMRRILINYANNRLAKKRGGGQPLVTFNEQSVVQEARAEELVALDEALSDLAKLNERQSKVVECQFFGGLTHEEIAAVLGVSVPTVRRDWRLARAWLSQELANNLRN
jgi:RNA polymerase sigma factor (TIGR02999 family)